MLDSCKISPGHTGENTYILSLSSDCCNISVWQLLRHELFVQIVSHLGESRVMGQIYAYRERWNIMKGGFTGNK